MREMRTVGRNFPRDTEENHEIAKSEKASNPAEFQTPSLTSTSECYRVITLSYSLGFGLKKSG
jgi:hypothetical protein